MSKILVVEDNLPNRELIREILESCGHEVIEAEDGQQALERLKETKPDLVLLDLQMPVLDGYAVVRQLRQIPRLANLKYWHSRLTPCRVTGKRFCNPASMVI